MKLKRIHFYLIVLVGVVLAQFALMRAASVVTALPPRPTVAPTPRPDKGGQIELQVEGAAADVWTLVQWQDAEGDWHDVDGWQGSLDDGRSKTWWVGEAHLGSGPFRWVVLGENNLTEISEPFDLPALPDEKVIVTISLD